MLERSGPHKPQTQLASLEVKVCYIVCSMAFAFHYHKTIWTRGPYCVTSPACSQCQNASKHSWKPNSRLASVRRISLHLFFWGQTRQFINHVWMPADLEETLQGYAGISSGGGGIWFGLEWFGWLHREGEQQDIKELAGMGTIRWDNGAWIVETVSGVFGLLWLEWSSIDNYWTMSMDDSLI